MRLTLTDVPLLSVIRNNGNMNHTIIYSYICPFVYPNII